MRPFYRTLTTLVHGLVTSMTLLVLADVASPTLNIEGIPDWGGSQAFLVFAIVLTVSFTLGLVMDTISRGVFHSQKRLWTLDVLVSKTMRDRLAALGEVDSAQAESAYAELLEEGEDTHDRAIKAEAFMQIMEYQVMTRAYHVFDRIQIYREQHRMARGFILPLAILAFVLPFWAPVAALDVAGSIGPFPIIRAQVWLVSLLASAVNFVTFRERAYRYCTAKALAWVTMEAVGAKKGP